MPKGLESPSPAAVRLPAALVLLVLLASAGCGGTKPGDTVKVEAEQQREMNKLLTDDYNQMYRDRYTGKTEQPR
jgi:hypothetical protein